MKTIELGSSGVQVSAVSLGCMRIGNMRPAELETLVERALERGISFFDHADIYAGGASEALFGDLLAAKPSLRERMHIQSKCGIRPAGENFPGTYDFSREHILKAVDGSLRRLKTDYMDVLLLHRPDALVEPDEVAEAFDRLHSAGKVRHFGVSNMNPIQIELLAKSLGRPIVANQLQFSAAHTGMVDAGIYMNTMIPQGIVRDGGVLDYCRLKNITVQTWSTLQYGMFEGSLIGSERYPALNAVLDRIAAEQGAGSAAVAIAWVLRHPAHMQAIVGTTSPERLEGIAKAADLTISREQWYEIYRAAGNKLP